MKAQLISYGDKASREEHVWITEHGRESARIIPI